MSELQMSCSIEFWIFPLSSPPFLKRGRFHSNKSLRYNYQIGEVIFFSSILNI